MKIPRPEAFFDEELINTSSMKVVGTYQCKSCKQSFFQSLPLEKKCPSCGSKNLTKVKISLQKQDGRHEQTVSTGKSYNNQGSVGLVSLPIVMGYERIIIIVFLFLLVALFFYVEYKSSDVVAKTVNYSLFTISQLIGIFALYTTVFAPLNKKPN